MQLFDLVPENFFSVLTSKHKLIFAKAISIIYRESNAGSEVGIRREIVGSILFDQLREDINEDLLFDEEENHLERKEFVNFLLRRLKDCNWIDEEIDNNYQRKIAFTKMGFKFASLLSDLISGHGYNDSFLPEVDYQNFIYTIYLYLRDYQSLDGKIVIERVFAEMNELRKLLKELSTSIKTYIERSLAQKDLEKILHLHFDDYRDTIGQSYHLLKTSDNVAKFKGSIIDYLEDLMNNKEYLDKTITAMIMETEIFNREFFVNAIHKKMMNVLSFFTYEMDLIIKDIDNRHAEYIRSTINRFKYLSNRNQDVEGQINKLLKHLVTSLQAGEMHEKEIEIPILENLIQVSTVHFLDEKSFYVPRNKGAEFTPTGVIVGDELDKEKSLQELFARLEKRQNKRKAQAKVLDYLGEDQQVAGKNILVRSPEEMLELINVIIYGQSHGSSYNLEILEEYIESDYVTYKDFILRRK